MTTVRPIADDTTEALELVVAEARRFLASLDSDPVRLPGANEAAARFGGALPDEGSGTLAALTELVERGLEGVVRSPGPRFFHWVIGGATPAALGADWLASLLDQNAGGWDATPLGTRLEVVALAWLRELFDLPEDWGGVLTTGATMANFVALAAARGWWGEQHGVDVAARGLAGLPPVPVFSSGYVHASARKALAMLGLGRESVRVLARDGVGRLDLEALERELDSLDGGPAIVIANAGEVNAGDFDPIGGVADLVAGRRVWLHVDGAFGLFARTTPLAAALADGVERADSVIADAHKWLNVPYDSGFAFVRDPALLARTFRMDAACFRVRPPGRDEAELDELNRAIGDDVLRDGRVYVGTTLYGGRVAFRPAIVNWRTTEADVDLLVDVIRELAQKRSGAAVS